MKKRVLLSMVLCCLQLIMYAQNVGIGTNTPAEKLHVAGNIKADTVKPGAIKFTPNAGDGKILVSDAAGNAAWKSSNLVAGNIGYGVWGDCATNGNISEYQPVTDTGWNQFAGFGSSVALSGNFAIIGSPNDHIAANSDQGSACVFQFDGTKWVFFQRIIDATGAAGDKFGTSVGISGNYMIIGAPQDDVGANGDQGSASIYLYNGSSWVLMQKISSATGSFNDYFGYSVAISGNKVIIGAIFDDIGAVTNQGSASIYSYNGSSWVLEQLITDATGAANDNFGCSVSISGNNVVVGAYQDDNGPVINQGSASTYQFTSSWIATTKIINPGLGAGTGDEFGWSVSVSGDHLVIGSPNDNSNDGMISFYRNVGAGTNSWLSIKNIYGASVNAAGSNYGWSVFMLGNYMIAGSPAETQNGSAVIYQLIGTSWMKIQKVTDPAAQQFQQFGLTTAIDGTTKRFLVGAFGFDSNTGKAVFGKVN